MATRLVPVSQAGLLSQGCSLTSASYLSRFIDVVRRNDGGVFAAPGPDGQYRLIEYSGRRFANPITLDFDEAEFTEALEVIGNNGEGLWPDAAPMEVGLRLALVHLQESMATLKHEPTRMYFDDFGLTVR
jgi:hypothetical protein